MKATKKNVAEAIFKKFGHKVELVKGHGYFHFTSAEEDFRLAPITYAFDSSVYTNGLWTFDVERWVGEYAYLIDGVEVPKTATDPVTTKIRIFPKKVF